MRLVFDEDEVVAAWVALQLGQSPDEDYGTSRAIGIEDGNLIAGVIYNFHRPEQGDIDMTIAAVTPRWATRGNVAALLHYPFIQLDCQRVTALAAAGNTRSRIFLNGIGFKQEGVKRRGYGDDDMIIHGMLREEAMRWLKGDEDE